MPQNKRIFVIAGEDSGDIIGANLIKQLKKHAGVKISGIGGDKMIRAGLPSSLISISELSVMGFWEVLPKAFRLNRLIKQTVEAIIAFKPDVLVTIDSPGFNKRVVKQLRQQNFKTKYMHYVAPTVWAYKPKRAEEFAQLFDHLLCILPFEPPYFDKAGLKNTYVGHPLVEAKFYKQKDSAVLKFCKKYNIKKQHIPICIMPGSRNTELNKHLAVLERVVEKLVANNKNVMPIIVSTPSKTDYIASITQYWKHEPVVISSEEEKKACFAISRFGLIKSGTSSLEVAFAGLPHLIFYKTSYITSWIVRRLIKVKFASIVNLLKNREIIPEFIQQDFTEENILQASNTLLNDSKKLTRMTTEMTNSIAKLSVDKKPSEIASQSVLEA